MAVTAPFPGWKELSQRPFGPWLFAGGEDYLLEWAKGRLWPAPFDPLLLDGEVELSHLISLYRTLPLGGSGRAILWRKQTPSAEESGFLLKILKEPCPSHVLLWVHLPQVDKRTVLAKGFTTAGRLLALEAPPDKIRLSLLQEMVAEEGVLLDPAAASLLLERSGHSLRLLRQEVAKLAAAVHPGAIGRDMVQELVPPVFAGTGFELLEQALAGRQAEAVRLLKGLLAQGEVPLKLLGLLAWQVRLLLRTAAYRKGGGRAEGLAAFLKVPPFSARRYWAVPGDTTFWARRLMDLAELDLALKGGGEDGPLLLTLFVLRLAPKRGA